MIDILKSIIDLIFQFFNEIFFFEIDLTDDVKVPIGIILVAIVFFFGSVFIVLKAIGIMNSGRGDE